MSDKKLVFNYEKFKDDMLMNQSIQEDANFAIYKKLDGKTAEPDSNGKYYIDGIEVKKEWFS